MEVPAAGRIRFGAAGGAAVLQHRDDLPDRELVAFADFFGLQRVLVTDDVLRERLPLLNARGEQHAAEELLRDRERDDVALGEALLEMFVVLPVLARTDLLAELPQLRRELLVVANLPVRVVRG